MTIFCCRMFLKTKILNHGNKSVSNCVGQPESNHWQRDKKNQALRDYFSRRNEPAFENGHYCADDNNSQALSNKGFCKEPAKKGMGGT